MGGSLYLSCVRNSGKQCILDVQSNNFSNNSAKISGGAIYFDNIQPIGLLNNNFTQNQAKYGNNYASFPTTIKIINNNTNWAKALVSGKDFNTTISVGLFDQNDQLYNIDSDSECQIFAEDVDLSLSGNTKVKAENGIYNFTYVNFVAKPDFNSTVKFSSSAITQNNRQIGQYNVKQNFSVHLNFPISFRKCIPGEVTQNKKCVTCMRGTFSIDPNKTFCDNCIEKANCPGGTALELDIGKWRNITNQKITIYDCLVEDACKGGINSECQIGYEGIFCSRCSINLNNKTYARTNGYKCQECQPLWNQISFFALVMILKSAWVIYILFNLFQNPKRNKPQTVLIRIITNYIQIVYLVESFDLEWPIIVSKFLKFFVQIADSQESLFSFDCTFIQLGLKDSNDKLISSFYFQVISVGITPVAMSILSIPFWLLFNFFQNKHSQNENQQKSIQDAKLLEDKGLVDHQPQTTYNQTNRGETDKNKTNSMMEESKQQTITGDANQAMEKSSRSNSRIRSKSEKTKEIHKELTNQNGNQSAQFYQRKNIQDITKIIEQQSHSQILDQTEENINGGKGDIINEANDQKHLNSQVDYQKFSNASSNNINFVSDSTLKQKLLATFFVFVLLWQPTIINNSFSLFMCTTYEDGLQYLKKDTTIQCWKNNIQVMIGATFIGVWAIIFPIAIYYIINKEKGRLDHPSNLKLYGIFYIGLNDDAFYWEIIVMNIRKIAIIVVATFFSNNQSTLKSYIGILAIFLQRHFSHYKMPFIDPRFNEIENLASIASITTIFGGLILLPGDDKQFGIINGHRSEISQSNEIFKTIILVLILILNSYFIGKWIYYFVNVQIRIHFQKIQLIMKYFKWKPVEVQIDNYEQDLQKWRSMQDNSSFNIDVTSPQHSHNLNENIRQIGRQKVKKDSLFKWPHQQDSKETIIVKSKVDERLTNNFSRRRSSRMENELPDSGRQLIDDSLSDSLVDLTFPKEKMRKGKELQNLKLDDWDFDISTLNAPKKSNNAHQTSSFMNYQSGNYLQQIKIKELESFQDVNHLDSWQILSKNQKTQKSKVQQKSKIYKNEVQTFVNEQIMEQPLTLQTFSHERSFQMGGQGFDRKIINKQDLYPDETNSNNGASGMYKKGLVHKKKGVHYQDKQNSNRKRK